MPNHAGSPCCRDTYCKQADNLKKSSENGFSAGAVTAVHNIIAGTYGSGGKIDEYHIFAEKHSLCSKAEQGKQGAVE